MRQLKKLQKQLKKLRKLPKKQLRKLKKLLPSNAGAAVAAPATAILVRQGRAHGTYRARVPFLRAVPVSRGRAMVVESNERGVMRQRSGWLCAVALAAVSVGAACSSAGPADEASAPDGPGAESGATLSGLEGLEGQPAGDSDRATLFETADDAGSGRDAGRLPADCLPMALGMNVTGALGGGDDVDGYMLELGPEAMLTVRTSVDAASTAPVRLVLHDPSGVVLHSSSAVGVAPGAVTELRWSVDAERGPGQYMLWVQSTGDARYQLHAIRELAGLVPAAGADTADVEPATGADEAAGAP